MGIKKPVTPEQALAQLAFIQENEKEAMKSYPLTKKICLDLYEYMQVRLFSVSIEFTNPHHPGANAMHWYFWLTLLYIWAYVFKKIVKNTSKISNSAKRRQKLSSGNLKNVVICQKAALKIAFIALSLLYTDF